MTRQKRRPRAAFATDKYVDRIRATRGGSSSVVNGYIEEEHEGFHPVISLIPHFFISQFSNFWVDYTLICRKPKE